MLITQESLTFQGGYLVLGTIYILLAIYLKQVPRRSVSQTLAHSSGYLLDDTRPLNAVFARFLAASFEIQLSELLPFVQHAAGFFGIPAVYCLPDALYVGSY